MNLLRTGPMLRAFDDRAPVVRILADETDSDGLRMVQSLRERGADADIWSLHHLDQDEATGALAYRGADVATPEFAIPYHPRLSAEMFEQMYALERSGIPMNNPIAAMERSIDKGKTAVLLREAGVPHPETIEVTTADAAMRAVERLHREGVPVFIKNPVGTQGIGVAGIADRRDAIDVARFIATNSDPDVRARGLLLRSGAPDTAPILAHTPAEVEAAITRLYRPDLPINMAIAGAADGAIELRSRGEALAVGQLVTAGLEQGTSGSRLLVQAGIKLPPGEPLHDTRHFLNAYRHLGGMDRVQEIAGEMRTGLSSGAVGRVHHSTPTEIDTVTRASRALGLEGTSGADMISEYVVELNGAPGQRMADIVKVDLPGIIADDAIARVMASRRDAARASG